MDWLHPWNLSEIPPLARLYPQVVYSFIVQGWPILPIFLSASATVFRGALCKGFRLRFTNKTDSQNPVLGQQEL